MYQDNKPWLQILNVTELIFSTHLEHICSALNVQYSTFIVSHLLLIFHILVGKLVEIVLEVFQCNEYRWLAACAHAGLRAAFNFACGLYFFVDSRNFSHNLCGYGVVDDLTSPAKVFRSFCRTCMAWRSNTKSSIRQREWL